MQKVTWKPMFSHPVSCEQKGIGYKFIGYIDRISLR